MVGPRPMPDAVARVTRDKAHRGPVPPVFFLLALAAALIAHRYAPTAQLIKAPWTYLGLLFMAAGFTMAIVSAGAFVRAGTPVVPFRETTALVKTGFFRFTRNPMYLGMVLVLLGVNVLLGSLSPFVFLPLFIWIIQRRFIDHEEKLLEQKFGPDYIQYKKRVRRWL